MDTSQTSNSGLDINGPQATCVGKFNNCSPFTDPTMADRFCMDQNCVIEDVCDTKRFIGHSIDTRPKQYSEIQSAEISDLVTPVVCNNDRIGDTNIDRHNNEISVRLTADLHALDINQNSPEIKISISEEGEIAAVDNVNSAGTANVIFGLDELNENSGEVDSIVLNESSLNMEDCVFKEETLAKAKSDTHLDNYVSTVAKVRKLSPSDLTSASSTNNLRADISDKVPLRCRRRNTSGSDTGRRSRPISEEISGSEDEVLEDGEFPPCDCDECLFNVEQDRPKPPPQERKMVRKQSSWKKIRNIVHWSPFIQQFKRRRYPWIQLAGHQGNFHAGEQPGAILKKFDSRECKSFHKLMKDVLRPYVPEFRGEAIKDGEWFIQLQDLLCEFEAPCVMDIKMGCRTYLEEELTKAREKPTLRKDMYQKMLEVDPSAPTAEEHNQKAITKPRYMQWRDEQSSSVELGFRIEGIRKSDGANIKNFKTTKQKSCIKDTFRQFVSDNDAVMNTYLRRLKSIQATQEVSPFFKSHEIIGSSLLFVHDKSGQASIWMIDFGKTVPLPDSVTVDHKSVWVEGNHEDGYLSGVSNLIEIFEDLVKDKHENSKGCNSKSVSDSPNEIRNVCDSGKVTESEHKNPETVSNVHNDSKKPETNEHSTEETPSTSDVKHKESSC